MFQMTWSTVKHAQWCAPREDSDQPAFPCSLLNLLCPFEEALGPWLPIEHPANTGQAVQMIGLVWFLFYGPSTHFRSFGARSVSLTTLFLGKPPWQFTSTECTFFCQHCSSWISGRRRMGVEMFFHDQVYERMCLMWGSNSGSLACQAGRSSYHTRLAAQMSFLGTHSLGFSHVMACSAYETN